MITSRRHLDHLVRWIATRSRQRTDNRRPTRFLGYVLLWPGMAIAYQDQTDEQLMLSYGAGDAQAFSALLLRYKRQMYSFFLRQTGSTAVADDLFQELFVRVIKSADTYEKRAKFSTWLYRIARNLCIDHFRAAKHRNHASLDVPIANESGRHRIETIAADEQNAEGQVDGHRFREDLATNVTRLPDEQREVFVLRMINQLSFSEIAEVVSAPEGTVKSRLRYALSALKSNLSQYRQEAT